MCAEYISMQSSFVISSLSHISIELSGTDMRNCPEQTSAHTCTHMYKHTQADIHAHAGPVRGQTLRQKKKKKGVGGGVGFKKKMQQRAYSKQTFD